MSTAKLQAILKAKIPLSTHMRVKVVTCNASVGVRFALPLLPNRNHKKTAFGGSLVAAQALASWAYLMELLENEAVNAEVVIQREHSEFLLPVASEFTVETNLIATSVVNHFFQTLKRHGKARIEISAKVLCDGRMACRFTGQYVAIKTTKQKKKTR
jgi:thioesterase domain-containing protein